MLLLGRKVKPKPGLRMTTSAIDSSKWGILLNRSCGDSSVYGKELLQGLFEFRERQGIGAVGLGRCGIVVYFHENAINTGANRCA